MIFSLQVLLYSLLILLLCYLLYFVYYSIIHKLNHQRDLVMIMPVILICVTVMIRIRYIHDFQLNHPYIIDDTFYIYIPIIGIIYGIAALVVRNIRKKNKDIITKDSIREGINKMSAGLCFYDEDGLPLLMNENMEKLSYVLFNNGLLNGKELWENLESGNNILGKRVNAEYPTYQCLDGNVYAFSKQEIYIGKEKVHQLLAGDVTNLYEMSQQIEINNKELAKTNIRLQEYNENISVLTRDEEILNAKIRVHDDLGHSIIATKYHISNAESTIDQQQLLKMWKTNISLLRKEDVQKTDDSALSYLYDAAKVIGLKLVIDGNVKNWDISSKRLLSIAVRECMTNAIKHAMADTLYVYIKNKKKTYLIIIEDNGSCPSVIVEGGGLSTLRKQVEKVNGTMRIYTKTHFKVEIEIPGKGEANV